jgi:glutamyl-tRNA synthetase
MSTVKESKKYVGRIAPTPSGHMHVGHAQTFLIACNRAKRSNGEVILRVEDLDMQRCKSHFLRDMIEDLMWIGIAWQKVLLKNIFYNAPM